MAIARPLWSVSVWYSSLAIAVMGAAMSSTSAARQNKTLPRVRIVMIFPLSRVSDEMCPPVLLMMLSSGKKLRRICKTLEFEGIAARINDEECSLFADFTCEANSR